MIESDKIVPVLKDFHISKAALFGSAARNEPSPGDIDILIEAPKSMGLFEFIALKDRLSEILHTQVDLVTYSGLHPLVREQVLQEAVPLL